MSLPKVQELRSRVNARIAEARTRVRALGLAGPQVRLGEGALVEQARRRTDVAARRLVERNSGVIPMVKEFRSGEGLRRFFPYITDNTDVAAEEYTANPSNHRDTVGVTAGILAESQRQIAEEFRRGMTTALGMPPEAIREDVVQRWIVNWTRAFTRPEQWVEVVPTTDSIRDLGRGVGDIARSAFYARERSEMMRQAQPSMTDQPQRTTEEPQRTTEEPQRTTEEPFSSSISVVKP